MQSLNHEFHSMICKKISLGAILMLAGLSQALAIDAVTCVNCVTPMDANMNTQSITQSVDSAGKDITSEVRKVGQALQSEQQKNTAAMSKIMDAQTKAFRDIMVAKGVADAKTRAKEIYGAQGTYTDSCDEDKLAQGMAAGNAARRLYQKTGGKAMKQYARSYSKPEEAVKDILKVKEEDVDNENLNPSSGTLTKDAVTKANELTRVTVNPSPPAKLPESVKSTTLGQRYDAMKRIHESMMLQAEAARLQVNSHVMPDYEVGQWAKDAWSETGKAGDPPGVVDGKMSYQALLRLLAHQRLESSKWYADVMSGKNSEWHAREQTLMIAVLLDIQREQLELMRHMTALAAEERGSRINETVGSELNRLRNQTIGQ